MNVETDMNISRVPIPETEDHMKNSDQTEALARPVVPSKLSPVAARS